MTLTNAEKRRQLDALLRAGVIDQKNYDQRLAALERSAASPSAAPTSRDAGRDGARRPSQRMSAEGYVKAPYRFAPYDSNVMIAAEKAALRPIDEPKPDGLCAELVVRWEAEGPLLIGQENHGVVTPMRWPGGGGFFIPGSTLRGAIRSVCEIIGAGRLAKAHVNLKQAFALRDFTHQAYSNAAEDVETQHRFPLARLDALKAGWLKLRAGAAPSDARTDEAMLEARFEIEPAPDWHRIEADTLWSFERPRGKARDAKEFTKLSLIEKYAALGLTKTDQGVRTPATFLGPRRFARDGSGEKLVRRDERGSITGCYAFSGPSPSGKRYEYVIEVAPGASADGVALRDDIWKRFVRAHSRTVKERLKPDGAWKDIPAMFRADPTLRLPVFYVGDLDTQDPDSFAFGLTRLFKVPHVHSLEQVLDASGVKDPVDASGRVDLDQLDIVDALFGYVYETGEKTAIDPATIARKGRIAFSPAELRGGKPVLSEPVATVMMAPRSSFAPFYLTGLYKDYSAPGAPPAIAGRKRYPVRQLPGQNAETAFESVRTRLEDQIAAIRRMNPRGEGPNDDVVTKLRFLLPQQGSANLTFESRIRLFNVTPVELGLVVDAVTLGANGKLRHAVGRAKPFGAGQIKATIADLRVETNRSPDIINPSVEDAIKPWTEHRGAMLADAKSRASYTRMRDAFEACCDPARGDALARQGKLDYLRLREQPVGANRPENPYVRLRDWVKPMKNAAPPDERMAGALLVPGRGGAPPIAGR